MWDQLQTGLMAEVAKIDDSDDDGAAAVFGEGMGHSKNRSLLCWNLWQD
jgi:hypothetical protein